MALPLVEKAGTFLIILLVIGVFQASYAAVHKVGDSAGWTIISNIDYKNWASTKNFHIGDTIVFEYNAQFHNVMRVTHAMYKSCNASSPLKTFTSGNDSIKITNYGHHFFLCAAPGHCQAGQKVDINVLNVSTSAASATTPTKSPSAAVASPVPTSNTVAPSPSNAAPFFVVKGAFAFMCLVIEVLAFSVSNYA